MVAIVEALVLTGLVLPAAAAKVGRHDFPLPSQTVQVRDEVGDWSIAPTPPPNPRFAAMALKRQDGGPTCGYYEYNSEAFDCYTNQACVTKDSYFGCTAGSQPYTACLDAFNPLCSQSSQGLGTLCCNFNTDFPLCVTAIKPITGNSVASITGFRCGNNRAKGSKLLLESKGQLTTTHTTTSPSASASDSSATTPSASTVENIPAETSTTDPSPAPSPATPVGAIVGGVIGGLAVIGLTVLGIVWIWLRNRRGKGGASTAVPSVMNQSYTYSPMPLTGAPPEPRSPPVQSTYDVNSSYKGYFHQSAVGTPEPESYYHSAPTVSISNPTASEAPYQPVAASHGSVPNDRRRLSEVPAINPAGTGNNATELPSERYDRY
ncbi:hypothetical protein CI238_00111 [Colletotrichum incanum]|uniref:Uncharacterized protein n=1 Tax=Colletotrichum incanum TaxID=1573173 RepID=A0A166R0V6_COLIC|nr:hypothetical protein CI238_00111 [Colletotrichum incanum]OHW93759.1 hypothetical protein CSPAE12_07484 [Colletotrichum incanum]